MKKICYLALLVLISCSQQKAVELVAVEPQQDSSIISKVQDSIPVAPPAEPESELNIRTISVKDNIVLAGVANYPFSKELSDIKEMLDSLGVKSEFIDGEYGGLSYDSAEITCNRSYGESICEADIRSRLITLSNGMKLGISLVDFLKLTGLTASNNEQNLQYEYTYGANEHDYTMRFDFLNRKLVRFIYKKDPCVIYD